MLEKSSQFFSSEQPCEPKSSDVALKIAGVKKVQQEIAIASCATFLFLPHFDVICDLLLNRRTATWNLFVKCAIKTKRLLRYNYSVALITYELTNVDVAFLCISTQYIALLKHNDE